MLLVLNSRAQDDLHSDGDNVRLTSCFHLEYFQYINSVADGSKVPGPFYNLVKTRTMEPTFGSTYDLTKVSIFCMNIAALCWGETQRHSAELIDVACMNV